jgi:cholesterol transport system auxiliary component
MTPRTLRALGLAASLALSSSCGIVPERETLNVYQLPPMSLARSTQAPLALAIRVATPEAGELTGGTRILVMRQDNQVSVYQGARWIDPAAQLVRNRLAEAFRADGRFRTVVTDSGSVPADLELRGEIASYQVEYEGGKPSVRIRFDALLASPKRPGEAASRRFEIAQPVEGPNVPEVVQAFGRATDRLAAEVIAWAVERAAAR